MAKTGKSGGKQKQSSLRENEPNKQRRRVGTPEGQRKAMKLEKVRQRY